MRLELDELRLKSVLVELEDFDAGTALLDSYYNFMTCLKIRVDDVTLGFPSFHMPRVPERCPTIEGY